jgi:hypothetical protein
MQLRCRARGVKRRIRGNRPKLLPANTLRVLREIDHSGVATAIVPRQTHFFQNAVDLASNWSIPVRWSLAQHGLPGGWRSPLEKGAAMPNMDVWDWVMLALGGYVAVTSLVIMMRRRRDEVLTDMAKDAEAAREQKRQEELREAKRQKRQQRAA